MKKTLILGASSNPARYSYKATIMLAEKGLHVFPAGLKEGKIGNHKILTNTPLLTNIDTIALYLGKKNQSEYYDFILNKINPKRIIFNSGAENPELMDLAKKKRIASEIACTLVLLSINNY